MRGEKVRYIMTMIAMCGLVGSSVGICSGTAGLFYTAISEDLGISKATISLTYTISALASAFSGLAIPRVLRRESNLKPLIFAGVLLSCGGTALLSAASGIWMLYILSAVRGIGAGLLSFVLATTVINQWFLAKNGLMVSIAMAFSGLPNVLLANLFARIIETAGWRFGYLFVTGVMVLFSLPALLYPVCLRPAQCSMEPYGYKEYLKFREEHPEAAVVTQGNDHIGMTSPQMIGLFFFSMIVCIIASMLQHLSSFAVSLGMTAAVGALMTSTASAANIVSKLIYGVMTDRVGPYKSSLFCAAVNVAAVVILITVHTPAAMVIASFMFGFTFANSSTAMSMLTKDLYGMENYTRVYPLISFSGSAANAVGVTLIGMLYDASGSYYAVFIVCLIMQVLVLMDVFSLMRIGKKEKTA